MSWLTRLDRSCILRLNPFEKEKDQGLQCWRCQEAWVCSDAAMSQPSTRPTLYKGYRFPPEIISRCVWLYYRFDVSLRDVSELMLARGIVVSHEAIRIRTLRFTDGTIHRSHPAQADLRTDMSSEKAS
jgi:hypothetical protein